MEIIYCASQAILDRALESQRRWITEERAKALDLADSLVAVDQRLADEYRKSIDLRDEMYVETLYRLEASA